MPFSHSIPKSAGFVSRLYLTESSVFPSALTGRLRAVALVLVCLLVGLAPIQLHAQNVTLVPYIITVAGNGTVAYSGDNGPATSAGLAQPFGAIVDSTGTLYIADTYNQVIRKVDTSGIVTTVAGTFTPGGPNGTGVGGYSGDNGPATSAQLNGPSGMAMDSAGNLYIADQNNHAIRKVDANGFITTVAGNGTQGYSGDGYPATSAQLNHPARVAVDRVGNLYIADTLNNRIRKVNPSGTITPWRAAVLPVFPAIAETTAQPPARTLASRGEWQWTARATCTSRTMETMSSARWTLERF
jgi:NHL repeat